MPPDRAGAGRADAQRVEGRRAEPDGRGPRWRFEWLQTGGGRVGPVSGAGRAREGRTDAGGAIPGAWRSGRDRSAGAAGVKCTADLRSSCDLRSSPPPSRRWDEWPWPPIPGPLPGLLVTSTSRFAAVGVLAFMALPVALIGFKAFRGFNGFLAFICLQGCSFLRCGCLLAEPTAGDAMR